MNMTPEQAVSIVENDLIKMAGVIRNRLLEGLSFEQSINHESTKFWLKAAKKFSKKIHVK